MGGYSRLPNQKRLSGVFKPASGAQKRKKKGEAEEVASNLRKQATKFFRKKSSEESHVLNSLDSDSRPEERDVVPKSTPCSSPEERPDQEVNQTEVLNPNPDNSVGVAVTSKDQSAEPLSNATKGAELRPCQLTLSVSSDTESVKLDVMDPSTWQHDMTIDFRHQVLTTEAKYKKQHRQNLQQILAFWKKFKFGRKPNKEICQRTWLRISLSTGSAFCMPCSIFASSGGTNSKSPWVNFGGVGFKDFKHSSRAVQCHETSVTHLNSVTSWKAYIKSLNDPQSLVVQLVSKKEENVSEWRKILRGIVDAVMFLAQNNLSFQGASHSIQDDNCGNFLNLIKLLSKYYTPLDKHVRRLKKGSTSYLSPEVQNEFVTLCGSKIKETIINDIKKTKYFSIMLDSTPDTSHLEQVSHIIRTVKCTPTGCSIEKNFVEFISTTETKGYQLADMIIKKLEEDGLELSNWRGQGYDNGSNMSGKYSGVQALIIERNSEARFVPCAAHSLNRVGVNAAEKVFPAKLLLGNIQNFYKFFVASPARWEVLKKHLNVSLKGHSDTRWSSKAAAVGAMLNNLEGVIRALEDISDLKTVKPEVIAAADSKIRDVSNYKFVLGLTIWNEILSQINTCNIKLQAISNDASDAEKMLRVLLEWLKSFKETGFEMCRKKAELLANKLNISLESGFETVRRGRGVNPKYDGAAKAAKIRSMSNMDRFRMEFYDCLIDALVEEMSKRFVQIKSCVDDFKFLWGELLEANVEEKLKYVADICQQYPNDFDASSFSSEIQSLGFVVKEFLPKEKASVKELGPLDVLDILYKNELEQSYPNSETALRIFLTLPVIVASNERAFSKLKLIKNYLRSSMGQERLNGLSIISIERIIASQLDFDDIINQFAAAKCRKASIL